MKAHTILIHRSHVAVGEQLDIGMMCHSGHFWGGDAGTTIEGGEDFTEGNHLAADAWLALDKGNLETLVTKIKRGLHTGNPAADNERIYVKIFHNGSFLLGRTCLSSKLIFDETNSLE
jgi:hypothetical protein